MALPKKPEEKWELTGDCYACGAVGNLIRVQCDMGEHWSPYCGACAERMLQVWRIIPNRLLYE